jgi:ferrochelatase
MKTGKWVGPDLKDRLRLLSEDKKDEIVIIPIAFVNENLETLYDLDHDIISLSKNVFEIKNITRVKIPVADIEFIRLLVEIVEEFSSFANKTN